ncbi:MAG: maleate cis-trans isomerase family protein [Betaproteobacteria bacterium]
MKPVYGAKGRIGLVVPANNSVIEPELWSALPAGCAVYATRLLAKGDLTPQAIRRMERDADAAVAALAATGVDVIAYCDMVTTFIMQPGWNEDAVRRFGEAAATPCISAWTALRDALAKLGARRLALGTPYPASIHALVPPFFQARGFEVRSHATLDILAMREVPTVDAARLSAFVSELDSKRCDALVLLATDLPTFGSIATLERELGLPVLTSNQTILWRALSELRIQEKLKTLGRLFQ